MKSTVYNTINDITSVYRASVGYTRTLLQVCLLIKLSFLKILDGLPGFHYIFSDRELRPVARLYLALFTHAENSNQLFCLHGY